MGNDPTSKKAIDAAVSVAGAESAPFKISAEPQIASRMQAPEPSVAPVPEKSAPVFPAEIPDLSPTRFDNLGDLPTSYQTGQIYLAARDPHWLFVYWDLDLEGFDRQLMVEDEATFYIKVFTESGDLIDQIRVNTQAKNWYFPIKEAGMSYYVELGFNDLACKWAVVGTSNTTLAPADSFTEGAAEFASVPFHLSFNRMLDLVQGEMAAGQSLVGSLARLQGDAAKNLQQIAHDWTEEQRRLLETLVGSELVSAISLGSAEVDQIFRKRLSEALSESLTSPSSSEIFFLKNLVGGSFSESSLFSGVGASWSGALGGDTSWSGAVGSSWSAQPFGGPSVGRDFFMHVNAEVIFYGGTHPDATVWIDGQEIPLAQDGSFRYHFRLPDGEFEIPIVAESPDGVEVRSAKLVFKRGTSRTGEVGHTPQPGRLNTPIGAR